MDTSQIGMYQAQAMQTGLHPTAIFGTARGEEVAKLDLRFLGKDGGESQAHSKPHRPWGTAWFKELGLYSLSLNHGALHS